MTQLRSTIEEITANIKDAQAKPLLRPVVESSLLKLGYDQEEVAAELDDFFRVTLQ